MHYYKVLPLAICRVPAFTKNTTLTDAWDELKIIISQSSPEFYNLIKNCRAVEINQLDEKIRFTIFKYFNRAQYRATPYGKFASLTVVPVFPERHSPNHVVLGAPVFHNFADWSLKSKVLRNAKWILKNAAFFQSNATFYRSDNRIKYLFFNGTSFELSSIDYLDSINMVLNYAKNKRSKHEIFGYVEGAGLFTKQTFEHILKQLIDLQLLLTDLHPNIIGEDYFVRAKFSNDQESIYTITERPLAGGGINQSSLGVLKEAILFLNKNLPYTPVSEMKSFKERFLERFEQSEVPLSFALDPHTGVGYGNLESHTESESLANRIKSGRNTEPTAQIFTLDHFLRFILSGIINRQLVQTDLLDNKDASARIPDLPNSLNAIIKFSGNQIVCERMGGSTANTLLGRFSVAGGKFEKLCKTIAEIEQKANQEIIFFDVAYMAEERVDNVNRRLLLYNYEFPILSYAPHDQKLDLEDMMISIQDGEIILRSKKLKKRLIPRIATAYNYTRSDLSLFRFLSDLQNQNLRTNLSCDMQPYFPGLDYYPRIQYKNVILAGARWLLPQTFSDFEHQQTNEILDQLKTWLANLGLNQFRCGAFDQKLTFDAGNQQELRSFLVYARNKSTVYIEEYFHGQSTLAVDENNHPFEHELIVNFYHENQVYAPIRPRQEALEDQVKVSFPLGSEWLYFEIYCHYSESNTLLSKAVRTFISKYQRQIETWFFIRYNHPESHIRLRIKLKKAKLNEGFLFVKALSDSLKSLLSSGVISNIIMKPYLPEIERYGARQIRMVERFFSADSDLVLKTIGKRNLNHDQRYLLSMHLLEYMLKNAYSYEEILTFSLEMGNSFAKELGVKQDNFKRINSAFKLLNDRQKVSEDFFNFFKTPLAKVKRTFDLAVYDMAEPQKKRLIADLFHMHVNRLFITDQRIHEMIIYQFFTLELKRNHFKKNR